MTPVGRATVELRLTGASEPGLFVDEDDLGDLVMRTVHRFGALDDGCRRVTYRVETTGPADDQISPELGPQISRLPETLWRWWGGPGCNPSSGAPADPWADGRLRRECLRGPAD